jgi:hypothetical protein
MAKYQLTSNGVFDTETNRAIPEDVQNRDWREYLEWQGEGNTPDPIPTPPAPTNEQLLNMSDKQMIRAVDWLLEYLVGNGTVVLADIPQGLKDLYVARKAQRGA